MNYVVDHIPKSTPHNRRNGWVMKPEYITIHSTGNPRSTAKNERGWLTNPSNTRQASFHIAVDEKEAIECIPLSEVTWHAGDGRNGTGNRKTISIEICESGNREKTLENAVELTAKLLYERGWGIDKLRRHFDWSGKNCPRILNYNNWKGWTKFKNDVQKELNKLKQPKKEVIKVDNKNQTVSNWAKEAWDWAKKNKIADGKRPKDTMTREEMVTMLYRFNKLK